MPSIGKVYKIKSKQSKSVPPNTYANVVLGFFFFIIYITFRFSFKDLFKYQLDRMRTTVEDFKILRVKGLGEIFSDTAAVLDESFLKITVRCLDSVCWELSFEETN